MWSWPLPSLLCCTGGRLRAGARLHAASRSATCCISSYVPHAYSRWDHSRPASSLQHRVHALQSSDLQTLPLLPLVQGQRVHMSCHARAGILENGIVLPWLSSQAAFITYESHVLFALRFMVDCSVVGGGWVELPAGSYQVHAKRLNPLWVTIDICWEACAMCFYCKPAQARAVP